MEEEEGEREGGNGEGGAEGGRAVVAKSRLRDEQHAAQRRREEKIKTRINMIHLKEQMPVQRVEGRETGECQDGGRAWCWGRPGLLLSPRTSVATPSAQASMGGQRRLQTDTEQTIDRGGTICANISLLLLQLKGMYPPCVGSTRTSAKSEGSCCRCLVSCCPPLPLPSPHSRSTLQDVPTLSSSQEVARKRNGAAREGR